MATPRPSCSGPTAIRENARRRPDERLRARVALRPFHADSGRPGWTSVDCQSRLDTLVRVLQLILDDTGFPVDLQRPFLLESTRPVAPAVRRLQARAECRQVRFG